jgi:ATP-binding cassette subfamily C protein
MALVLAFLRRYPWRTLATLAALLSAGLMEGIGMSTLLPIVSTTIDPGLPGAGAAGANALTRMVPQALAALGLEPSIGVLLVVMVTGILLKSLIVLLAQRHVGYTVAHIATDLRLSLIRAVLAARWEYFARQPIGRLANSAGTEAIRASYAYYNGARVAAYAVTATVYLGVALAVSWRATLLALGAAAILLPLSGRLVRATRRAGGRQTRILKSLLGRLSDTLQSVKPLKAMACEDYVAPLLESETRALNRTLERDVISKEAMRAVQEPTIAILIAAGLYIAIARLQIPPAVVLALVFLLARGLYQIGMVQRAYQAMMTDESAYWSLTSALSEATAAREAPDGGEMPRFEREIRLAGVHFGYGEREILHDVSLELPAGSFTAILGPSGSGKTTVVDLIAGLLQPQSGFVLVDGKPLTAFDLRAWRSLIGYVPQETGLMHETVLANVTLGDPHIDVARATAALQAAGAWAFVSALPSGIESSVGERGTLLSGGQRQRIVIARALVRRPRLLILDEATSALDHDTELAIYRTLRALEAPVTILAVSHRPAVETIADRVYRFQDSALVRAAPPGGG